MPSLTSQRHLPRSDGGRVRDAESLVFVAHSPPFPADAGGPIRVQRLLSALAHEFQVTLITPEHHPHDPTPRVSAKELQEMLPDMRVIGLRMDGPTPDLQSMGARASGILSPRSSTLRPFMADEFKLAVRDVVERTNAVIVHFDFHMIGGLTRIPGAVNVFAPHNIEHRIRRADARHVRGRRRFWAELDWRKLRRDERLTWRHMDLCLAVSEVDAEEMRAAGARRVEICPNGTDPVTPFPKPSRSRSEPLRILFVGNGLYEPYARGLRWFVSEVLPRIRSEVPAELDVIGHTPRQRLESSEVRYLGTVPDVAPWYERAHVAIVPVFEGSGTRLKIPEALAYGRPVVSTTLGAEGLPLRAGEHYLRADDAFEFASSVVTIARETEHSSRSLESTLRAGREAVRPMFWPQITAGLVDLYRELVGVAVGQGRPSSAGTSQ